VHSCHNNYCHRPPHLLPYPFKPSPNIMVIDLQRYSPIDWMLV
jgi:hypothetical protein